MSEGGGAARSRRILCEKGWVGNHRRTLEPTITPAAPSVLRSCEKGWVLESSAHCRDKDQFLSEKIRRRRRRGIPPSENEGCGTPTEVRSIFFPHLAGYALYSRPGDGPPAIMAPLQ